MVIITISLITIILNTGTQRWFLYIYYDTHTRTHARRKALLRRTTGRMGFLAAYNGLDARARDTNDMSNDFPLDAAVNNAMSVLFKKSVIKP